MRAVSLLQRQLNTFAAHIGSYVTIVGKSNITAFSRIICFIATSLSWFREYTIVFLNAWFLSLSIKRVTSRFSCAFLYIFSTSQLVAVI